MCFEADVSNPYRFPFFFFPSSKLSEYLNHLYTHTFKDTMNSWFNIRALEDSSSFIKATMWENHLGPEAHQPTVVSDSRLTSSGTEWYCRPCWAVPDRLMSTILSADLRAHMVRNRWSVSISYVTVFILMFESLQPLISLHFTEPKFITFFSFFFKLNPLP